MSGNIAKKRVFGSLYPLEDFLPEIDRDILRRLRNTAGLTQKGLAKKSGVSLDTIKQAEQWKRSMFSIRTFRLLARALSTESLEIRPSDLMYEDDAW